MYIKFLKDFVCVNKDKVSVINKEYSLFDKIPRVDGELRFFDGSNPLCFANEFLVKAKIDQILEISSYNYDDATSVLDFTLYHKCTNNKICTDLIDITTWQIHSISKGDFEILED